MLDAGLIAGPVPTTVSILGALAGIYLLAQRQRRWWTRQVPAAVAGGVLVAGSVAVLVAVLRPFPGLLSVRVLVWVGVAVAAVSLVYMRRREDWRRARWWRGAVAVCATVAMLAMSVVKINAYYGYRPTIAAVLGIPGAGQVVPDDLLHRLRLVAAPPQQALLHSWHPPPDMPAVGRITTIPIPGHRSHFAFGGTCALQLSLRRPEVFRTFLDVSGQLASTLGDLAGTVRAAFSGDLAAYRRVDPLTELRTTRYPGTAGVFVVGRNDEEYRPQAERLAAAARGAGLGVALREVPGEHSWAIAGEALATALPWIAGRTGLIDPVPSPTSDAVTPGRPPPGG